MKTNYKWKYEELSKIHSKLKEAYLDQHNDLKKVLACWGHSLDIWKFQLKTDLIQSLIIYIFGMLIGIGITWSVLK